MWLKRCGAGGEGGKIDEDGRPVDGEWWMESGVEGGAIAENKFGGRWRGRVWSGQPGVYSAYKYERSGARLQLEPLID